MQVGFNASFKTILAFSVFTVIVLVLDSHHRRRHAGASRGTGPGWKRCAPAGAPAGKILVF
jgi:hypothetical protein